MQAFDDGQRLASGVFPLPATGANTQLTIGTASASTAALSEGIYRLECAIDCQVVSGATALLTDMSLKAGVPELFAINSVVSAIAASASTLNITKV